MSMRRPPELRPTVWDGLTALVVLLLALGLAFFQWQGGGENGELTAVVIIDGEAAYRFAGYTLTVVLGIDYEGPPLNAPPPGGTTGIRVALSDCPTQDCVHTGIIDRSGQSIVCLPARVIIRLEGGQRDPDALDAVLG